MNTDPPDVANWYAGNRMLPFVRAGLFEDVSDIWSDSGWVDGNLSENMEHAKKSMTIGGKQWGIPYTYYQWGVYYRKDIFNNLGISVPKTWDEFVKACETIKASGVTPITIGSKYLWTTAGVFDYLNLRTNGYEFHMDLTLGKVPYTDAKVQAVFDKWDELVKPGYFLENHAALSWQEALTPMINGEAAMYVMGNFAVAPLKAKAKNKTDAKRFLIFMSRADVQEEINKILGQLPINKNSGVKEGDPFLSAGLNMLNNAYAMAQFYDRDAPAQMASEGMKGFQEYMSNPDRRQKILERLEKVRQRVYK